MSKVNIILADGFEDIEALAVVDLLRRAKIDIDMVSIMENLTVTTSHNIKIQADKMIEEVEFDKADMIVLPGGLDGTNNISKCDKVIEVLKKYNEEGKKMAAICAAPSVFGDNGLLEGKKAICYPGFEDRLKGAEVTCEKVVVDDNIITSRGMGTAIDFGLKLIEILIDKDKADEIAKQIIYY